MCDEKQICSWNKYELIYFAEFLSILFLSPFKFTLYNVCQIIFGQCCPCVCVFFSVESRNVEKHSADGFWFFEQTQFSCHSTVHTHTHTHTHTPFHSTRFDDISTQYSDSIGVPVGPLFGTAPGTGKVAFLMRCTVVGGGGR